ncbi:MAG: amino acid adenylation domain-containing protein [bacterium]|nr:amino acid adenylation domain-containing protein [bacterium]
MKKIEKKNIEDIFALTPVQEGMLFHYLKDPESDIYFEQLCIEISGEIEPGIFEQAWNFVAASNRMLRVVFRWEKMKESMQIVLREHLFQPVYYDFSHAASDAQKKMLLEEVKVKDREKKFDLREVPFRVTLCKTGNHRYEMVVSNHHILYDGWSNGIILREFFDAYRRLQGGASLVEPEKTDFKEFVRWVRRQDRGPQETFWTGYLKGFDTPCRLPVKAHPKGEVLTTPAKYQACLPGDETNKLQHFVKEKKITLASLLYSAWGILLQKYTSSGDVVFGTTVSGRSAKVPGIEEIVGLFINTVPVRIRNRAHEKTGDLLTRVDESLRTRAPYDHTPLVEIKEYSELYADQAFFETIVVLENYPLEGLTARLDRENSPLTVDSYSAVEAVHYGLAVGITLTGRIEISFLYNSDLFDEGVIEGLSRHFILILRSIASGTHKTAAEIEIVSGEEKQRLLYAFNDSAVDFPREKTLHQLFEEQAARTPDYVAIIGHRSYKTHMTYSQLNRSSGQSAYRLQQQGVAPGDIVAIKMEPSLEMLIGIYGVLKAGAAYLPIDPDYPQERIDFMMADSNANGIVTPTHPALRAPLSRGDLKDAWADSQCKSPLERALEGPRRGTPKGGGVSILAHSPENLAYVIYTSGSTGTPKGVMVEHRNVVRLIKNTNYIEITSGDRLLQLSNYAFDGSVFDIYGALCNGAALILAAQGKELAVERLARLIKRRQVTVFFVTTALFNTLVDLELQCFDNIRKVLFGGERVSVEHTRRALAYMGPGRIVHVYGPTETTVFATYHFIDRIAEDAGTIPIGRPVANTTAYILDGNRNPVPIGVGGELYIGGEGTARGYLNNPELTLEKFSRGAAPSLSTPLYRSGDLARWLPDGPPAGGTYSIEFLGRVDSQVKIRGFRIEPGEIESRLREHPGIRETAVIAKEDEKGEKYLIAYIVGAINETPLLKKYLSQTLPDYMVPSYFMNLERIPLTANGKIDRRALPVPVSTMADRAYTAPRDELDGRLVLIWSEVLGIPDERIGIDANFFEVGGHSLKAAVLTARIHKALDVNIPLPELFNAPTIRGLAEFIKGAAAEAHAAVEAVEKREYYPLSSAQKRLYFLQQLDLKSTVYNMPAVLPMGKEIEKNKLESVLNQLIARHESLRTSFHMIGGEPVQRIDESGIRVGAGSPRPGEFIRPFDLSRAPLLRVEPVESEDGNYLLMVDMHHIISDGVSVAILLREFMGLYNGETPAGPRLQYKDYVLWRNRENE